MYQQATADTYILLIVVIEWFHLQVSCPMMLNLKPCYLISLKLLNSWWFRPWQNLPSYSLFFTADLDSVLVEFTLMKKYVIGFDSVMHAVVMAWFFGGQKKRKFSNSMYLRLSFNCDNVCSQPALHQKYTKKCSPCKDVCLFCTYNCSRRDPSFHIRTYLFPLIHYTECHSPFKIRPTDWARSIYSCLPWS